MDMMVAAELMKKYGNCPECGNGNVGGTPTEGSLNIGDGLFQRGCKCGWNIVVDRRIRVLRGGSTVTLLAIYGQPDKLVSSVELKKQTGFTQVSRMNEWLNTEEGRAWALTVEDIQKDKYATLDELALMLAKKSPEHSRDYVWEELIQPCFKIGYTFEETLVRAKTLFPKDFSEL